MKQNETPAEGDRETSSCEQLIEGRLTVEPTVGIIKPIMGIENISSSSLGNALYPRTRQAVLRLFFSRPDQRFLQKEVIQQLGAGSGAVQRELDRLSAAEILIRTVEGRQTYFQANRASPIYEEMRGLVRKTFGVPHVLQKALETIPKPIDLAFVYGSVASGTEKSASDIDLMVVSDEVSLSDLIPAIREAEKKLGREVNPSLYSMKEFRRKLADGSNFLTNVMRRPKIFLLGNDDELGKLAQIRVDQASQDKPRRDRGTGGNR